MEESSDSHMETDVSSTTDDVPESRQVTSYHGDVETVVVVEELKEDEECSIDSKFEQPQGDKVSSGVSEASPQKDRSPQKLASRQVHGSPHKNVVTTPIKETNEPRSLLKTPVKNDANPKPNIETPNVDSSTKIDTTVSPSKANDTNCIKLSPIQVSHKTTFKPIKLVRNSNMVPKLVDKTIKIVKESSPKVIKIMEVKEAHNIVDSTKAQAQKDGSVLEKSNKDAMKESPTKEQNTKESSRVIKLSPSKPDVSLDKSIKNKAENTEQNAQEVKTPKESPISLNTSKIINSTTNITDINVKTAKINDSDSDKTAKHTTASDDTIKTAKTITNESDKTAKSTIAETAKTAKYISDTTVKTTKIISASNLLSKTTKSTTNNESVKPVKNISDESKNEAKSTDNETKVTKAIDNSAPIARTATEKSSVNTNQEVLEVDKDPLDVSQNSDVPEKEHNKSISRELKSLINSAKESKIISECTQLTSKTRKSRIVDSPNTSIVEGDKVENRRGSTNSQVSTCSEKSDKPPLKRSMRSQNPEFVTKCKQFLNSVTSKVKESDDAMSEDETDVKDKITEHTDTPPKKKKISQPVQDKSGKLRSDTYCWRCHYLVEQDQNDKAHPPLHCTVCPRSYHYKCLSGGERKSTETTKSWVCPDCLQILSAESSETRSPAMKKTSLGTLCVLLKHALDRMMELNGAEPFVHPVDRTSFPDYDKYIVHPMDLTQMKQNIEDGHYGSTEAFVADVQWILHNSIIFNTLQSKLTAGARALLRSCKAEMGEIEACPECYAAAHAHKPTWFTDVCTTPHILLWAKLKGFPYWPAKGMTVNSAGLVDVRFFGAHDRAWVPAKDCFLFSEKDPNNFRNKRQDILDSMLEAEQHIRNISRKYGKFVYPPFKTQFEPTQLAQQLKLMIPSFEGEVRMKDKPSPSPVVNKENKRSLSKSSKSSANDGDVSETDDSSTKEPQKSDKENIKEKEKPMEVDKPSQLETIPSRKRRRSNLEEAVVITIMNSSSPAEKKRKIDPEQKKSEPQPTSNKPESTSKKEEPKESKKKVDTPKTKSKDEEPTSTLEEKESLRVTPIKLVALPRTNKQTPKMFATKVTSKPSTPKEEDKTPQKTKVTRSDKTPSSEKPKEVKAKEQGEKRRTSRSKSASSTPKVAKPAEKKAENNEASTSKERKTKEVKRKDSKESEAEKSDSNTKTADPKPVKERLNFDDDTSLAVIARTTRNTGMPTITNVCSLSTTAQSTTTTNTITNAKSIEVTIEANSDSSIFTPTSTDNVRNMQDAVTKLQKLRETEPLVGRVGVKAFARMTSPPRTDDNVQVEIKAEPIDLEEADEERHNEKMDLMNACKLRPVNQAQSLRDVRINRVVVPSFVVKKTGKPESRARAKKTFPQPRRVEESRSELNGKNSMVYIPIQPPMTPVPIRGPRPNQQPVRPTAPAPGNKQVNTVTMAFKPTTSTSNVPAAPISSASCVPTVGQVPTTVHTVPLMTSVNGHWMLSLQPVMSVGGDGAPPTIVNGITERTPSLIPIAPSPSTPSTPTQSKSTSNSSTPTELPRLQQRPLTHPFDCNSTPGPVPPPPAAGPVTAKLNQRAVKMAEFFQTLIEETIERLDDPAAVATSIRLQLEHQKWKHQQEIDEIKHNHELSITEMRLSLEKEKLRAVSEARRVGQVELEAAVKLAKSKQWCANCYQEAQLYCCWNTAYCDYPCQRAHWPMHYNVCAQTNKDGSEDSGSSSESRLPQPDCLPSLQKSAPPVTPVATADKVSSRLGPAQEKNSIIVSMVEDNTGNQTMKCVGTYKSNPNQTQISPIILNKQLITDETGKKVVTSGGYLIVGASNNSSAVVTPASTRRSHNIQYFT